MFDEIKSTLDNLREDGWVLLTLERDVTLQKEHPTRFSQEDKDETMRRYRTLSERLFGRVRQDR